MKRRDDATRDDPASVDEDLNCHCQGGRLILLMGDFDRLGKDALDDPDPGNPGSTLRETRDAQSWSAAVAPYKYFADPTMAAARAWLLKEWNATRQTMHLHVFCYSTSAGKGAKAPSMVDPQEPVAGAGGAAPSWQPRHVLKANMEEPPPKGMLPKDCCYFDEVIVVFHGSSNGVYSKLKEFLPRILGERPVRKLVLWSCASSNKFYPDAHDDDNHNYAEICWIVRPRDCGCGCTMAACNAHDADLHGGKKCPTKDDPVHVITAGYTPVPGSTDIKPHLLSLDPDGPNPFTAPGHTVRDITIAPGSFELTEALNPNATVLGKPVGTGGSEEGAHSGAKLHPKKPPTAKQSGIYTYDKPYSGPKPGKNQCLNHEGCLPGV